VRRKSADSKWHLNSGGQGTQGGALHRLYSVVVKCGLYFRGPRGIRSTLLKSVQNNCVLLRPVQDDVARITVRPCIGPRWTTAGQAAPTGRRSTQLTSSCTPYNVGLAFASTFHDRHFSRHVCSRQPPHLAYSLDGPSLLRMTQGARRRCSRAMPTPDSHAEAGAGMQPSALLDGV
jgi:hypothetical protein